MDKQWLEWLQCVRDYSDGVLGYGGYVIAGPGLHTIDQQLRKLGYVVGIPNRNFASVITVTGREVLVAQDDTHNPAARSLA
jgi:hypothetical protein